MNDLVSILHDPDTKKFVIASNLPDDIVLNILLMVLNKMAENLKKVELTQ